IAFPPVQSLALTCQPDAAQHLSEPGTKHPLAKPTVHLLLPPTSSPSASLSSSLSSSTPLPPFPLSSGPASPLPIARLRPTPTSSRAGAVPVRLHCPNEEEAHRSRILRLPGNGPSARLGWISAGRRTHESTTQSHQHTRD
ncbi:MAG: hypothetical protein FE78DRAFT_89629, partial [Acidomyces sp. 'richmondensis']